MRQKERASETEREVERACVSVFVDFTLRWRRLNSMAAPTSLSALKASMGLGGDGAGESDDSYTEDGICMDQFVYLCVCKCVWVCCVCVFCVCVSRSSC
jgi:hypothetical protein